MTEEEKKKRFMRIKAFLIPVLRRASYRWSPRSAAMKKARVDKGKYKCEICESIVGAKEFTLDHREHVVPIQTGFDDWNGFIDRLYCEEDGFSVICKECDKSKTILERELRKEFRKLRKEKDESDTTLE
jgi:hypothetical protein